jgi:hypothetical protein
MVKNKAHASPSKVEITYCGHCVIPAINHPLLPRKHNPNEIFLESITKATSTLHFTQPRVGFFPPQQPWFCNHTHIVALYFMNRISIISSIECLSSNLTRHLDIVIPNLSLRLCQMQPYHYLFAYDIFHKLKNKSIK